jgi:membrane protein required for colicin V production
MNPFDAVIYVGLVFAMIAGFNTGLVRSAVTIVAL